METSFEQTSARIAFTLPVVSHSISSTNMLELPKVIGSLDFYCFLGFDIVTAATVIERYARKPAK